MDDFHQINYVLNKTKSIKDEVKDENSETRQILVKMFLPEEEEEMEVSRNYYIYLATNYKNKFRGCFFVQKITIFFFYSLSFHSIVSTIFSISFLIY